MAPTLLAMETATGFCSLSVLRGGRVAAYVEDATPNQQAARLFSLVDQVFHQAEVRYNDLDGIVVSHGPGSFTGIRMALAAAQGMAIATGKPLYALSTLEILAHQAASKAPYVASILNAGKGQVYAQCFATPHLKPAGEACILNPVEIAPWCAQWPGAITCGTLQEHVTQYIPHPRADALAELAAQRLAADALHPGAEPFYIRPPDAKLPVVAAG